LLLQDNTPNFGEGEETVEGLTLERGSLKPKATDRLLEETKPLTSGYYTNLYLCL
jgi:hypothetical protein